MSLTTAQIATLKTEINSDPNGLGYAAPYSLGSDDGVAALINAVGAGAAYSIYKNNIPLHDMIANIASSEFTSLTSLQVAQLQFLFQGSGGVVDATDTNTRNIITAIFAGKTSTLANFAALAKRQGSRAEVLFGVGVSVSGHDVGATRP